MIKAIKVFLIAVWNVWFYILGFIGIVISLPFLFIFSVKESYYPYFYWIARNIWSNIIMYGMGFYPEIKFKQHIIKGKSYMLVSNHKSMIDIMLMLSLSKDPIDISIEESVYLLIGQALKVEKRYILKQ